MSKRQLAERARSALRGIFGFIAFYSSLILLGLLLIALACAVSWYVLFTLIPASTSHLKLVALQILCLAGIWGIALLIGGYLVRPLFIIEKRKPEAAREIFKEDAPALFALIEQVAKQAGTEPPMRVYLTAEADAYVFFDASYWGLLKSARKNLAVGIGLMQDLSKEEFKAVLAHEFGHFAQSAMHQGAAVWILSQMIDRLLSHRGKFDERIETWAQSEITLWKLFGLIARRIVRGLRALIWSRWQVLEKADLALSRQMEFDADEAAQHQVGSATVISMLAKLPVIERRSYLFAQLAKAFYREKGELLVDFWDARMRINDLFERNDGVELYAQSPLTELPRGFGDNASKLTIEDTWSTHPAIRDRIDAVGQLPAAPNEAAQHAAAFSLIPEPLARTVGLEYLAELTGAHNAAQALAHAQQSRDEASTNTERFHEWAQKEFQQYIFPLWLEPFFGRELAPFEIASAIKSAEKDSDKGAPTNPFTQTNEDDARAYGAALADCTQLSEIAAGREAAASLRYEDIFVADLEHRDRSQALALPIERARLRKENLEARAAAIDEAVFVWLYAQAGMLDQKRIASAYADIFYAQSFLDAAGDMAQRAEALEKWLDRVNAQLLDAKRDEADAFCKLTEALMHEVTSLIPHIDWDALEAVEDANTIAAWQATSQTFWAQSEDEADATVETKTLTGFAREIVAAHQTLQAAAMRFVGRKAANQLAQSDRRAS